MKAIETHSKFDEIFYNVRDEVKSFVFTLPFVDHPNDLPSDKGGVYFVCNIVTEREEEQIVYVGKSVSFAKRWKNHWLRDVVRDDVTMRIYYLSGSPSLINEAFFISTIRPILNRIVRATL